VAEILHGLRKICGGSSWKLKPPQRKKIMKLKNIAIESILPSLTNPRKAFPEGYIAELSASIAQRGIFSPLLVRSSGSGMYDLISGECRLRAALLAQLTEVPCLVRDDLSESEVLELQLIENLQRKDLALLEEADGYAALLELVTDDGAARWSVDLLSEKIGKTANYLRQRLLLRRLSASGREALESGALSFTVARMISRIPTVALREKAMLDVLRPEFDDEPLTSRKAAQWIADHFMVDTKGVPWKLSDADLLPVELDDEGGRMSGGACADCPFLSSNAPEACEDLNPDHAKHGARDSHVCMNTACFSGKMDASWEESRMAALKAGKKVLSQEEADKILNPHSGGLRWDTNFVVLSDQVPAHELRADVKKPPTWKKLLSGAPCPPEICVVRDHRGKTLEIVDRRQAMAALKLAASQNGTEMPLRSGDSSNRSAESEKENRAKMKERGRVAMETAFRSMDAVREEIVTQGVIPALWPALLELALEFAGHDGKWMLCKWLQVNPDKDEHGNRDHEEALRSAFALVDGNATVAMFILALLSRGMKYAASPAEYPAPGEDGYTDALKGIAEIYGVDLKGLSKAARSEAKAKKKTKSLEESAAEFKAAADEGVRADRVAESKKAMPKTKGKSDILARVLLESAMDLYLRNKDKFAVSFIQRKLKVGYVAADNLYNQVLSSVNGLTAETLIPGDRVSFVRDGADVFGKLLSVEEFEHLNGIGSWALSGGDDCSPVRVDGDRWPIAVVFNSSLRRVEVAS